MSVIIRFEKVYVADVHWYAGGEDDVAGHVPAEHNRITGQNCRQGYEYARSMVGGSPVMN